MDSRIWGEATLALNQAGPRAAACDRRGHGRSTDPGTFDYASLADDLEAVLRALDLRGVKLVARAGGEAIHYAARHGTERLSRTVLVGCTEPGMLGGPDRSQGVMPTMLDAVAAQFATDPPGWIDANIEPSAPACRFAPTCKWRPWRSTARAAPWSTSSARSSGPT